MLGAKIDFVTEDIVEDANTVVGNRERAMERMRANCYNDAVLSFDGIRAAREI
jgi:hypothetical protein